MNNRRAITPSPEKPLIGLTRRAITPTPNRAVCEYQNLSVIQNKIFNNDTTETDMYVSRRSVENSMCGQYQNLDVIQEKIFYNNANNNLTSSGNSSSSSEEKEYLSRSQLEAQMMKKQQLGKSLSAESTSASSSPSHSDGLSIPDHLNQPRRRDSGNWSGDRNSASSSSSTTLDNPYLYLMNKRNNNTNNGNGNNNNNNNSMPASPTRTGQFYDAGYDSYSLSSTDSFPSKHPVMHLAKIPETIVMSGDCEKLCIEADQLLEKSKLVEDALDFETALVLCNAAAGKARAAMNAPYSNPHTMTFARMKHNTCVMRARSLHRRIFMEKGSDFSKDQMNTNSLSGISHRRQNSKDKTMHSYHNSKEMLHDDKGPTKSIEIYATLPKKKVSLKLVEQDDQIMPIEPVETTKKVERESRSIFGRSKDSKEKRSRSEDRNKVSRDFDAAASLTNAKDTLKKHKEEKDEKKDKDKSNKKQHKIRRKLLMGGLIRRKNRSMPDLTEGADEEKKKDTSNDKSSKAADDSTVGVNKKLDTSTHSGYVSEGHLEYHVTGMNPTLERSKLLRKSFHGSGRQLVIAKVPPPPPLRKTSALTRDLVEEHQMAQKAINNNNFYNPHNDQPIKPFHEANMSIISNVSSNTSMSEDSCQTIITCAQVHQEQSPLRSNDMMSPTSSLNLQKFIHQQDMKNELVDEVDCAATVLPQHNRFNSQLDLPPYPSPPSTTCHSRQASEDFPPPPAAIDLEPLNEQLHEIQNLQIKRTDSSDAIHGCTSILAHLQYQRQEALKSQKLDKNSSENFLKELQIKQMTLKKSQMEASNAFNVKDLATRFEQVKMSPVAEPKRIQNSVNVRTGMNGLTPAHSAALAAAAATTTTPHTIKRMDNGEEVEYAIVDKKKNQIRFDIAQSQVQEELREVEMLNQVVQNTLNNSMPQKRVKKKSVSFCDQVILVATANDDEDETFVPNPILERVLKSINNNGNNGNDDESKDQVDTPANKSNILATKQIPLQSSMHEAQYMAPNNSYQMNGMGLPASSSPKNDIDGFGYSTIEQIQKTAVYQQPTINNNNNNQINGSAQIMTQPQANMLRQYGTSQPQSQQMIMSQYLAKNSMQSPPPQMEYLNQNPSLNMPMQTPYMQLPPNSAIMRENNFANYPNNLQQQRQNYPQNQNPLAQQQQQPQQQHMANMMQHANFMMNRANMMQAQQLNHANVYQKLPQSVDFQNNYPYQRMNFMSPPHTPAEMNFEAQHAMPLNPMNPLSQLQNPINALYLNPPQMKTIVQKKVSFGPDTKANDGIGSSNNSSPLTNFDSNNINNNSNSFNINGNISNNTSPISQAATSNSTTTQVVPTKIAFNNNAIVKPSAKSNLCNLCRKQHTIGTSLYCTNCDSYLSRFNANIRR
jgi:hypothetical protein